jgi:hypothetical protein
MGKTRRGSSGIYRNAPKVKFQRSAEVSSKFGIDLRVPRLKPQYWWQNSLYATEDHFVYRSQDNGETWEVLGRVYVPKESTIGRIRTRLGRLRLVRRFRKSDGVYTNLLVLQSGTILVKLGNIFRSDDGGKHFSLVMRLDNNVNILGQGWTQDRRGNVYFGEYILSDDHKRDISVYRSQDDGRTWEQFLVFEAGEIRHIHVVQYDPYRDLIWISTGDRDSESRILYLENDGNHLYKLGGGTQDWRTVGFLFTPDYIYWGADTQDEPSHIFSWNWEQKTRERLVRADGPVHSCTKLSNGTLVFSTGVEHGEAETDSSAHIWVSTDGEKWTSIAGWEKEPKADHFGLLLFPQGMNPTNYVFALPYCLKGHKFGIFRGVLNPGLKGQ